MNILQSLQAPLDFCVTLNQEYIIDPGKIIQKTTYHHPVYTSRGRAAQKRFREISGKNRIHFCGAYWGYGFHEDGVKSALAVCESFGKSL
jgi:predicted NAD/FAD-binding protein